MTPRRDAGRRLSNLLALILVVLTVLPLVIFATDRRAARASRHPTVLSALFGAAVQLFWIAAAGVIGRRLFKLRL